MKSRRLGDQKGVITLDYLFAFILVGGFSFLIFALSLTLSVVEIVQYMTFASARNYYAGNVSPRAQFDAAQRKFTELRSNEVLAPLFRNGWFAFDENTLTIGAVSKSNPDLQVYQQDEKFNLFHGTVVYFISNVLDFNVPFFGSTTTSEQKNKKTDLGAYIGSYLGRETSFEECENFMIDRWPAIQALPNNQSAAPYSSVNAKYIYVPSDNGC